MSSKEVVRVHDSSVSNFKSCVAPPVSNFKSCVVPPSRGQESVLRTSHEGFSSPFGFSLPRTGFGAGTTPVESVLFTLVGGKINGSFTTFGRSIIF